MVGAFAGIKKALLTTLFAGHHYGFFPQLSGQESGRYRGRLLGRKEAEICMQALGHRHDEADLW